MSILQTIQDWLKSTGLDSRTATIAARPIAIPRLTPVSVPASRPSLVRVTAVVPASGTIRKLDDSGWIRQGK